MDFLRKCELVVNHCHKLSINFFKSLLNVLQYSFYFMGFFVCLFVLAERYVRS